MLNLVNKALLVQSTMSAVTVAWWSNSHIQTRDTVIGPSAAYQIYESDPDLTNPLGSYGSANTSGTGGTIPATGTLYSNMTAPTSTPVYSNITTNGTTVNQTVVNDIRARHLAARFARFPFVFTISQGAGGVNKTELVVAFNNLPCPPASYGPYSFEFNFIPEAAYNSIGNNQINMFRLPEQIPINPTYNNIQPVKGSLIGTFELPSGAAANEPKLVSINQLACAQSINLLFEIADTSSNAGTVIYINGDGMGLRERSGT